MPSDVLGVESPPGENVGERGQGGEAEKVLKCEECGVQEAKYRCPGCGLRSCCLPCVKSHKERTQCTGKRKRTSFVSVIKFDDNLLVSDYNLLEETLRQADAAKRLRAPLGNVKAQLSTSWKRLQKQAGSRSTTVRFVATGMSKRITNTSYFDMSTKRIFWRVEWTFEGTDVRLVDPSVDENLSLESILSKHLISEVGDVNVKHRLRNFRWKPVHELKLLLLKEGCQGAEKAFYSLNGDKSLRDQLANKYIIEYPIIHVLLVDAAKYNIVVEPRAKDKHQVAEPITPTLQEPEGVPFREEEIEEGEFVPS